MANYDKVKILVVGDSGVGKTSAVNLMVSGIPLQKPSWTVGVALEVKLHEFKGGTPSQKTYFIELWDIGGSSAHRNSRPVFYHGVNGIILVHDLSNRKSEANLHKWLVEIFNKGGGENGVQGSSVSSPGGGGEPSSDEFDPEKFLGSGTPPILIVGTKLDNYSGGYQDDVGALPTRIPTPRPSILAQECGADELFLNCLDAKSLAPGSTASVKLTRFFDRVIDRRFYKENSSSSGGGGGLYDRRKLYPSASSSNSRMFS